MASASRPEAKRRSLPVGPADGADSTRAYPDDKAAEASAVSEPRQDRVERVRAALRDAILPRLVYPTLARRRGWQGKVTVTLHLSAQGRVSGVRLVQTSGHAVLDRAAVRDLERVGELTFLSRWIDGDGLEVEIPVEYRLAPD